MKKLPDSDTANKATRTLTPEQLVEETRLEWRAAFEKAGLTSRWTKGKHDAIARRFDSRAIPDDIRMARELEEVLEHCRLTLEQNFILPDEVVDGVDPDNDARAARALVERLWKIVECMGPSPFRPLEEMELTSVVRDGASTRYEYKRREIPYAHLSQANQRRWRVAFMRYLDECSGAARSSVPRPDVLEIDEDDSDALVAAAANLPFSLKPFAQDPLDRLLKAWGVKRAGAKSSASRLNGKWEMLSRLLADVWGCTSTAGALEREYDRYAT